MPDHYRPRNPNLPPHMDQDPIRWQGELLPEDIAAVLTPEQIIDKQLENRQITEEINRMFPGHGQPDNPWYMAPLSDPFWLPKLMRSGKQAVSDFLTETPSGTPEDFLKTGAAGVPGILGDLGELANVVDEASGGKVPGMGMLKPLSMYPTTQELAVAMGADPNTLAGIGGEFASPLPNELLALGKTGSIIAMAGPPIFIGRGRSAKLLKEFNQLGKTLDDELAAFESKFKISHEAWKTTEAMMESGIGQIGMSLDDALIRAAFDNKLDPEKFVPEFKGAVAKIDDLLDQRSTLASKITAEDMTAEAYQNALNLKDKYGLNVNMSKPEQKIAAQFVEQTGSVDEAIRQLDIAAQPPTGAIADAWAGREDALEMLQDGYRKAATWLRSQTGNELRGLAETTLKHDPAAQGAASVGADYRGTHTAPIRGDDLDVKNTLDDATDIFGDDIYDPLVSWRYFGHGGDSVRMDMQSANIIAKFRNNPSATVTIYRAAPKGVDEIHPGDWVTINKSYAEDHGYRHVGDDYVVLEKEVQARELVTDGNSIHEWGYDPKPTTSGVGGAVGDALIDATRKANPGDSISGLEVGSDIPNMSSIRATFDDYDDFGVRAIPMVDPGIKSTDPDIIELAEQIKRSGRIDPLIIAIDDTGASDFVLEGSHRIEALRHLGVDEFPALLVKGRKPTTSGVKPKIEPCGHCFDNSFRAMIHVDPKVADAENYKLVHGKVTNVEGRTFDHSWVEHDVDGKRMVVDAAREGQEPVIMEADKYRKLMSAENVTEYDQATALGRGAREGHYGPWDTKPTTSGR